MVCKPITKVLKVLKFLPIQDFKHLYATEVSSKLAPVHLKKKKAGVGGWIKSTTTQDGWADVKG